MYRPHLEMEVLLKSVTPMNIGFKPHILRSDAVILLFHILYLARHIYFVCKPTAHCLAISNYMAVSIFRRLRN